MIPARHIFFLVDFFRYYIDFRIKEHFSRVVIHPPVPELTDKPLLIIGNHFSWWDGFFTLWLNNHLFHRRCYAMMLEEQLRKNRILNFIGAYSINPGSRDAIASIRYSRDILLKGTDPSMPPAKRPLLLMFPQGSIQSMHARYHHFKGGLEHIVNDLEGQITVLMTIALTDYFSKPKPELHLYLKEYPFNKKLDIKDLEIVFNQFLEYARQEQKPDN
ncbi:MAG: 1-acyl-sn-glycerol-3-phosphate acyltransferase [Bacteroidales bacterium]